MTARIKTGTTTWADRGLLASGWYPEEASTPARRLRFYASRFPVVENDSSYWAIPDRGRVQLWARSCPPGFTMNMKAHALLTGHYSDAARLPGDLRDLLPDLALGKRRIYAQDLGPELMEEVRRRFRQSLEPLAERGTLGLVLFQFPIWFTCSKQNGLRLARIRDQFRPYRIAVEFRSATWMSRASRRSTLELLAGEEIVYTCVDEPQGLVSSVPAIAAVTSDRALVRLHGRNAARWRRGPRAAAERFPYRYSVDELRQWVPRIRSMADRAEEVHVLMNNGCAEHAVHNAREMAALLELPVGALDARTGQTDVHAQA